MGDVKVSVIIAAYNAGKYISECIQSILSQTLKGIEIIVVDDGSTDNTNSVIKEYGRLYNNLMVLCQRNVGQGPARNRAIKCAKGEYIAFMDADDKYACEDSLEKLYNVAKANDALICGGNIVSDNNGVVDIFYKAGDGDAYRTKNGFINTENYYYLYGYTRYIYNAKLIRSNRIQFAKYRRYEDQVFSIRALYKAGRFYELDYPIYWYRTNYRRSGFNEDVWIEVMKGFKETLGIMISQNMKTMYEHNAYEEYKRLIKAVYKWIDESKVLTEIIGEIEQILSECLWRSNNSVAERDIELIKEETEKVLQILSKGNVVLYGAGNNTNRLLTSYEKYRNRIKGIAVTKLDGTDCMHGLKVMELKEYLPLKDATILITVGDSFREEMKAYAYDMGFENVECIDMEYVSE